MQALYRKYRSKSLSEVVGQEYITETLANALKAGRISHAYLFTGPRGVGKTSVARILAHEINKLPYADEPHLDIIEIDAASNRRIDDIRDLREKVHIAPTSAAYKVYIIDEVHMLTGESFNALLKTLEEPPAHVVFILATTEAHKLPATIISRTQRYTFRPVALPKVIAHLQFIAKQEKIAVTDDALALIAEHGEGSFRDSISLLDQLANISGGEITAATVEQTLGLAPQTMLSTIITALQQKNTDELIKQLSALDQQGTATNVLLPQLLRAIQEAAAANPLLYALLDKLLEVPRAYNPNLKLLTTLIAFTVGDSTSAAPAKHVPAAVEAPKAILEVQAPASVRKAPAPKAAPDTTATLAATPPSAPPVDAKPLAELAPDQWAATLAAIKATSMPLQSVFRQAEPQFDAPSQTLTLRFKYQLHRRRADDSKAKNILADALLATTGATPAVKTELAADAQPPEITDAAMSPAAVLTETAKAVADIMGGGEPVS